MSNLLNATIDNEKTYLLPICNLLPYNNSASPTVGGLRGSISGNNPIPTSGIVIPDYVKNLDIDYISFGTTPEVTTVLPPRLVCFYIVYNTGYSAGSSFPVIKSDGTQTDLVDPTEYRVELRVPVGELLPIDIRAIKRIDGCPTAVTGSFLAAPTNITLWKRFLISESTNKAFLGTTPLPSGPNAII
jgi:hypothetical protein